MQKQSRKAKHDTNLHNEYKKSNGWAYFVTTSNKTQFIK